MSTFQDYSVYLLGYTVITQFSLYVEKRKKFQNCVEDADSFYLKGLVLIKIAKKIAVLLKIIIMWRDGRANKERHQ